MLESCQPGSDVASDPALAPLSEELAHGEDLRVLHGRLQRLDGAIGEAFRSVPVPDGLEQRLLARLGIELPTAAAAVPAVRRTRRWLLAGGAVLALAGSLLVAVIVGSGRWQPYSNAEIVELAVAHFNDEGDLSAGWEVGAAPSDYPISRDVVQLQGVPWREAELFGHRAVAYSLSAVPGQRATLYVVRANVTGLPVQPLRRPVATGGTAASAWQSQSDGPVYVLVVEGGVPNYLQYLSRRSAPLVI
jgi:hypothetical protein